MFCTDTTGSIGWPSPAPRLQIDAERERAERGSKLVGGFRGVLPLSANIQDILSYGKTPHERRFGMPFNGPVIPFGVMVEYHPILPKTCRDCTSLARKSYHVFSSAMYCTRGESGKETVGRRY